MINVDAIEDRPAGEAVPSPEVVRYFDNPEAGDDWHYFIAEDPKTKQLTLVSDKSDLEDGHFYSTETVTFDEPIILINALRSLNRTGQALVIGDGTVRKNYDYLQIGSAWDDDEAVASGSGDTTKRGLITCFLNMEGGHLGRFEVKLEEEEAVR